MSHPKYPGLFHESEQDYHNNAAIGSSLARKALQSTQLVKDHIDGLVTVESSGFKLGTAWDRLHTGGGPPFVPFIVRPPHIDGRTKEGKEWIAANGSHFILTQDEASIIQLMESRISKEHKAILLTADDDDTCQLVGRINGVQCRVDLIYDGVIYDLKTTSKPIEDFSRHAYGYGYHIQAGWYQMVVEQVGLGRMPFRFLVTETIAPWRTVEFVPDSDFMAAGYSLACQAREIIRECQVTGDWSDQGDTQRILSLPTWHNKKSDQPAFD